MDPTSIPEGASPRTYDTDFIAGGWRQRPGMQNVYSYSGESKGPNPAFHAVDTPNNGGVWQNPSNILLNDGNYASVTLPATHTITLNVSSVQLIYTGIGRFRLGPISSLYVTFTSTPPASIVGSQVTFSGLTNATFLNGQSIVAVSISGNVVYFGSGYYGQANYGPSSDSGTGAYVDATITTSDYLDVTQFTFAVPSNQGITGVAVALKGYSSGAQTAFVQLLDNGVALDPAKSFTLPGSVATTTLGGSTDAWGANLTPAVVSDSSFGVRVYVTGNGSAFFDYVTITLYLSSVGVNFNYIGSLLSQTGIEYNLALDAAGNWWLENCTDSPGQLTLALAGTVANSYGWARSIYNRAFVCNSTLTGQVTGTDIPRQYNFEGNWWDRVTQVGPGAGPVISAAQSSGAVASITSISVASNIATITAANSYVAGEVGTFAGITGTGLTALNGQTLIVLSTGLSGTQFEVAYNNGGGSIGATPQSGATFTPQYTYPVATITQSAQQSDPSDPGHFQSLLWSAGPGSASAGNTITVYYSDSFAHSSPDTVLVNAFNAGNPLYVYISNAPFGNGVWQITSVGNAIPPHGSYYRWYFTYQVPTSNYQFFGGPDDAQGYYQITQGTVTLSSPVPGLRPGAQISIASASVAAWDGIYNVVSSLNSGGFNITQTQISGGVATYTWALTSGSAPAAGQLVTITNTLNANGVLNVTDAVIASATGSGSGTFTISGFASSLNYPNTVEQGQATTAGTQFIIDPGAANLGSTTVNPIFGNSTGGTLTIVGVASGGTLPIGAGTRQGVVIFVTRNGLWTAPSPPVTFTVAQGSNYIETVLPIGPPNVIGRLFACTEAGQNGIPGANFYTTTVPTVFQVGGVQYTSSSFLIPDNTTTVAKFTFSDLVLLQGDAIDIPGNNLFNLIEIGNPAWLFQYADRTFYGGCQNKVPNFNNLSFDGGYWQPTGGAPALPLGWYVVPAYSFPFGQSFSVTGFSITSNIVTVNCLNTLTPGLTVVINGLSTGTYLNGVQLTIVTASSTQFTAAFIHADVGLTSDSGTAASLCTTISLRPSPVFGQSLYIINQTGATQATLGMIEQSAYQDAWNAPILNPSGVPTDYSVRVTCRCPSGATSGQITIDVADSQTGIIYGSNNILLSAMTAQMQTFTRTLVGSGAYSKVPPGLLIRVWATNFAHLADCEIDRIEVFPTNEPVLTNTILVSYPQQPEQVDGVTGQLTLNSRSQDPVYGATLIHDQIVFKKANSIIEVEDAPNYEPNQWTTREVSARGSGACGPYAYAQGDEWDIGLNKSGFYVYSGGQPMPISRELMGFAPGASLWDQINWRAAQTFWLVNDIRARRLMAGVAMNTPNFWLPNASAASPTTPNVVLMLNYDGCPTAGELETAAPVHVTMFGSVKALDMRRKWSIWQIASPFAGAVYDGIYGYDTTFVCNGTASSKIYRLMDCTLQSSDDGIPVQCLYTTAALPDKDKALSTGIGAGRKYAQKWGAQISGSAAANQLSVTTYQDTMDDQYPVKAPYVPPLAKTQQHNIEWNSEVQGQRFLIEFAMNKTGTPAAGWVAMSELLADIVAHPWGPWRNVSS